MKPTSRFTYALKALVDLAVRHGTGPVTVAAIAKRQGIPVHSLEQLFNRLRRKGLVEAERGPRGGYRLVSHPDEIQVRTVFEVLEGGKPVSRRANAAPSASDPARTVWQQVERAVQTTLEATTLGALAAQAREGAGGPFTHRYTFHI